MIRQVQTNFTAGVLDSAMRSRFDLAVYRNGVAQADNVRLKPQGGATRRPGTILLQEYDFLPQIEPFVFDEDEAYVFFFRGGIVDIWDKITRNYVASLGGPWTQAECEGEMLGIVQQLDKMFVCHETFETQVITRTGLASFAIAPLAYDKHANGARTYRPWHKYAPNTATISFPTNLAGPQVATISIPWFRSYMIGHQMRVAKIEFDILSMVAGTDTLVDGIPTFTSANVYLYNSFGTEPMPSLDWDEEAFSPWRGWIRRMGLHDQRTFIGGGRDCPNVIWASKAGIPFNFDLGTADAGDGIKYPIYAPQIVDIRGFVSLTHLQIFCAQGEFFVPQPQSGGLTPSNFAVVPASGFGSSHIKPQIFDQTSIFVSNRARALREFLYDDTRVSYAADSLTFMSKKLVPSPIDLDVQVEGEGQEQNVRAYITNADGTLGVLSRVRKEQISAWHRWTTRGKYKKLGVIDREVWMVVEREIDGWPAHQKWIEVQDASVSLDCATVLTHAATDVWGPFPAYRNETVHVLSGTSYLGSYLIGDDEMLRLPVAVDRIEVGFNYVPTVAPLVQEVARPDGVTMGLPKRYVRVIASLEDTLSCRIKNRDLPLGIPEDDPLAMPAPFTGLFEAWLLGWKDQPNPVISAPLPLPFTLNSLMFEVEV